MSRSSPSLRNVLMTTRPVERRVAAQERHAEPAGTEDAFGLELLGGERREAFGVEPGGLLQFRQRFRPGTAFQGGEIGVVRRLGAG